MAIEIDGPAQLEVFLRDKPVEWSRVIAARAALRVLPVVLSSGMRGSYLFSAFRACFISWAAVRYPAYDMRIAAFSAARSAARSAAHSAAFSADSAAFSAAESAARSAADSAARSAARSAADSAHSAADSAAHSAARSVADSAARSAARSAAWKVVEADLNVLLKLSRTADLLNALLWPDIKWTWSDGQWYERPWNDDMPKWAAEEWKEFVQNKSARTDGYAPWLDWYTAVLKGADHFGSDLTLRIAQQPDEWWDRPVAEVNADIAAWLEEARESAVEVPPPEPGLVGTVDADGRVGFARSGEATVDELAGVGGLLQVLTGAAEDLAALLVGNNSVAIAPSIVPQYLSCLRADSLSIDTLYAAGVRLGNARAKLQKQIDSKDFPDLAPDVAEALDSVLELHGPVLLSTAEGRRLVDASSDYLRTAADNAALKRAAMNYGQAVAKSPDLFNKETCELLPALNEDVASGPHPERSTQVAMSASRNLLITVATVVLFETLKDGLAASVVGIGMTGVTAQTINFAWAFLTSYLPVIRELAAVSGPYLQWIEPLLRKAEKRLRE